jgi:fumarate hydratase class II
MVTCELKVQLQSGKPRRRHAWGAQAQRSLEHSSIVTDLIPGEMTTACALLKKAAVTANHDSNRLDEQQYRLMAPARRSRPRALRHRLG